MFEHNGRTFDEADLRAITDIGEGTKAEDDEQIGRFGIGFKAVFAYTETPRIWSLLWTTGTTANAGLNRIKWCIFTPASGVLLLRR